MAHPLVVHCKRAGYDVYIGRPSKWGNPFVIGRYPTRAQVVERYRQWLFEQPHLLAAFGELAGKTLGCWCAPHACHGDVLAELVAGSASVGAVGGVARRRVGTRCGVAPF
ncbi:DUF4326 domain-containing protein [Actinophytocola sp.]|uniref:DUF4326 domain-containing protein n=1 Tax=Actinophytocola sp. TaxID=1872138 RepID=UPI002D80EF21|nr:DUF4326 domain-containing protein [Actinophytocola sp.]HET9141397.1 DUF4326 domain-containing protein [Actinophytocola sp.]